MRLDDGQIEVMDEAMVPILRARTGTDRVQMGMQMFRLARETILASIHRQHPAWSEHQIREELIRRLHGAGE